MPSRPAADAHTAAQRLHARLGTDFNRPIDIFQIVQDEGIWLASKPLSSGFYGFYLRNDNAAGIVVNQDHPEPLQRYTCAHELGHHILGHQSHLDEANDIQGPLGGRQEIEIAAQAFAGAFLMPLQAVNRVMRRLGKTKSQRLSAIDVYIISRELDVSFSAAAWQLATLGRVSTQDAERWTKQGTTTIKYAMRGGPPPEGDNRAALYIIGASGREVPIPCRPGDELRLRLPENAASGNSWHLIAPTDPEMAPSQRSRNGDQAARREATPRLEEQDAGHFSEPAGCILRLVRDSYLPANISQDLSQTPEQKAPGPQRIREFAFIANRPGRTIIALRLCRLLSDQNLTDFMAPVNVSPTHVLKGFSRCQAKAHAAQVTNTRL